MSAQLTFALNHMATPRLSCREFLDLAASLGCIGVELRNDLADKRLSDAAFFDSNVFYFLVFCFEFLCNFGSVIIGAVIYDCHFIRNR